MERLAPLLVLALLNGCPTESPPQDLDGDGISTEGGDCNDADPNVFPGAVEVCDGVDNDCSGSADEAPDADADGYVAAECQGTDCDDANATIHPGAEEACDGLDSNCDGEFLSGEFMDLDGDGLPFCDDCNDVAPGIGAEKPCPDLWDGLGIDGPDWMDLPSPLSEQLLPDPAAVLPGFQVDYWELRSYGDGVWPGEEVVVHWGELCGGAVVPEDCEANWASLPPNVGWSTPGCLQEGCLRGIAWTSGDAAGVVGTIELATFLGSLNGPDELGIWLDRMGFNWLPEYSSTFNTGRVRAIEGGWEVVVEQFFPKDVVIHDDAVHLLVGPDGSVEELGRQVLYVCWECDI